MALAVVPRDGTITESPERADGKVWVTCRHCEERFLVHYRFTERC